MPGNATNQSHVHSLILIVICLPVRFFMIPLISAERCWAYAMQLKQQLEEEDNPRWRFHLLKRLKKAGKWAAQLAALCQEKGDTRTELEAEGYSAWMAGNIAFETENFSVALERFSYAKCVLRHADHVDAC